MALTLMYITNNLDIALIAEKYGVDRIWIDLERLGKEERQMNMDSVKSQHKISDIAIIKPFLTKSKLLVRVNPWNKNSKEEIEKGIDAGADIIMLPMWKSVLDVQNFINAVDGKAKTVLLLETKEAVECVDNVLKLPGIDEIHIGLNDLHLSYAKTFMFELLADGTVEKLCNKFQTAGLPYGFGGVSKIGDGVLPAEKIIMEHYRLGSTRVILSRAFCNSAAIQDIEKVEQIFKENIKLMRDFEVYANSVSQSIYLKNKADVAACVEKVVCAIKEKRKWRA